MKHPVTIKLINKSPLVELDIDYTTQADPFSW